MNNIIQDSKKYLKENKILSQSINFSKISNIIFSGYLSHLTPDIFKLKKYILYTQKCNIFQEFSNNIHKNIIFNTYRIKKKLKKCENLIFFWSKNKKEIIFELSYLFSKLKKNCKIYVTGSKKNGIRSLPKIFLKFINFKKIDSKSHYLLYYGRIKNPIQFFLKDFFKIHYWKNLKILHLPGVFGYKKIDEGSLFLISTFNKNIKGKILDLGSGSGILSVALFQINKNLKLHLSDFSKNSLISSQKTLLMNKIPGKIYTSNIFLNIFKKFNLIISNPPIHKNLKLNYIVLFNIITNSKNFLKKNGELRIIVNSFVSCKFLLKKIFKNCNLLKKNKKYKIYQSYKK
ncbi:methyltransferase [Buchnera aphidicola]|uniref:methyltransferase n=1 Tax=Buchnera aphidicola TaxID=9 RepID=UPI0031B6BC8A